MTSDPRITVESEASADDVNTVAKGLRAFNLEYIGQPNEQPVRIFLRSESGDVVGGLLGDIRWRWMYVARLWVSSDYRGKGHGAALMREAEGLAVRSGCIGIHLDTFEYQARPFYEKLGYTVFGTLEGYPPNYRQYYLSKRLEAGA